MKVPRSVAQNEIVQFTRADVRLEVLRGDHDAAKEVCLYLRGGCQVRIPPWLGTHICERLHVILLHAIVKCPLEKVSVADTALDNLAMNQCSLR